MARYQVRPITRTAPIPASGVILLTVDQPFEDHNGGDLVFGPDGYLYIGFGDGGRPAEPNYNSQDPKQYLGKMLRIDVNADTYTVPPDNPFVDDPAYLPEIWALGLRNPWRLQFDRADRRSVHRGRRAVAHRRIRFPARRQQRRRKLWLERL